MLQRSSSEKNCYKKPLKKAIFVPYSYRAQNGVILSHTQKQSKQFLLEIKRGSQAFESFLFYQNIIKISYVYAEFIEHFLAKKNHFHSS